MEGVVEHMFLLGDSHGVYMEDFGDQLMSKYTSLGLMLVTTLLVMKQYVFESIQCWVPAEWPRPWEEYAENYCWIQNTYNVAFTEPGFPGLQARKEAEISYFQWVPILLSLQAFLVFIPHVFWRVTSARSRSDAHHIIRMASEMKEQGKSKGASAKKQQKIAIYLSSQLSRSTLVAARVTESRVSCCPAASKIRCTSCLFSWYIVSKLVYVLNGLGLLYLMKFYLGYKELHFGWTTLQDLINGRQWSQTGVFPRVTFCDVPIKHVGQWNTRSIQCVLPMNMLNEKIYIFLWFWTVFCMALQVAFCVYWLASVLPQSQRHSFMRSLIRIEQPHQGLGPADDSPVINNFMRDNLRLDGLFILQMLAAKCGRLCAARIVAAMMKQQLARSDKAVDGGQDPNDRSTISIRGKGDCQLLHLTASKV